MLFKLSKNKDNNTSKDSIRVKYATDNFLFGSIFIAVTTIFPFVIRTILIRKWGLEYAGISSLFSAILNAINISELGLGEALLFALYKPMACKNVKEVNAILSVYRKIYYIIGFGILIIGLLLIPFLPHLITGSYPNEINIIVVFLLFLLNSVSGYLIFNYCDAIFLSNQASYIKDKWFALLYIIIYSLQIISILWTHNYYLYISFLPLGSIVGRVITFVLKKRRYGEYFPSGKVQKEFWIEFRKRIVGASIRKLRTAFRGSCDSVIISSFLGLVQLAKYQNYVLILSVPEMIMEIFRKAILQSLGNSISLETNESNLAVVRLYSFLTQWLGIWFAAMLGSLFHPFISIWIGEENTYSFYIEIIFSIYFYTICLTKITDLIRNSTGLWWEGKWIPVLECGVNLFLNILFVNIFGMLGILYATIISILIINIPWETWCVYRFYFNQEAMNILLQYGINFCECIIIVIITQKVGMLFQTGPINILFIRGINSIFLPNFLFFLFHLRSKEMWEILSLIARIIKNRLFSLK